jgi:hypothetical protein
VISGQVLFTSTQRHQVCDAPGCYLIQRAMDQGARIQPGFQGYNCLHANILILEIEPDADLS